MLTYHPIITHSLDSIDTVNQTFDTRLWIQLRWLVKGNKAAEEIVWVPKPHFANLKEEKDREEGLQTR